MGAFFSISLRLHIDSVCSGLIGTTTYTVYQFLVEVRRTAEDRVSAFIDANLAPDMQWQASPGPQVSNTNTGVEAQSDEDPDSNIRLWLETIGKPPSDPAMGQVESVT